MLLLLIWSEKTLIYIPIWLLETKFSGRESGFGNCTDFYAKFSFKERNSDLKSKIRTKNLETNANIQKLCTENVHTDSICCMAIKQQTQCFTVGAELLPVISFN